MRVHDRRSLEELIRGCGRFALVGRERIELALPWIPSPECERLEADLNRLWQECGCTLGAALSLVAVGLHAAFWTFAPIAPPWGWARIALSGVVAFAAAGAAGKLIGIRLAHRRLARQLRELGLSEPDVAALEPSELAAR
jgi:hypothetical protein